MSWYDSNNNDWYTPNYTQQKKSSEPQKKSEPKLPGDRTSRIIALLACLGLIITGIGVAISESDRHKEFKENYNEDGMPKSWQAYYDDFYSAQEITPAEFNLPEVEDRGKLSINFESDSSPVLSFKEIYANCAPSIVGIKCFEHDKKDHSYSWGSGVIISSDGYILTNAHVIDEGKAASVELFDGGSYDAKLVGADAQSDIAILKIDASGLKPASFASTKTLSVGDSVAAIGNPLSPDYSLTMTSGIISATSREVSYNGTVMSLLQTDTSINEGNSGGPLINTRGQVIGITNMKIVSSFSNIEGIGFAIPSDTVKVIVDLIMADGAVYGRSTIGITIGPIAEDIAEYYDIPVGLYVSAVLDNSDAAKQGIKKGDIITKVNGEQALTTSDVAEVKAAHKVGDTLTFTVWRDGKTFDVDVKLMDSNDLYKND